MAGITKWHRIYNKVWQVLQSAAGGYYKVWHMLKSVAIITKWDVKPFLLSPPSLNKDTMSIYYVTKSWIINCDFSLLCLLGVKPPLVKAKLLTL